jgi:hypothetical protein
VKLTEHEMLVTLATMALKMDDLTGHDVIEALRELGYRHVITEARKLARSRNPSASNARRPPARASKRRMTQLHLF